MQNYDKIKKENYTLDDLIEILKILRSPDGCPWDRAQTHTSVVGNIIEECYEVVDAIECNSDIKLQEELGDVLMQVAFHAVLAGERKAFVMQDILNTLCNKLIYRHSFVFGEDSASSAQEALEFWEKNKKIEKGQTKLQDTLSDLPKAFPALLRAGKAVKRINKAGVNFVEQKDIFEAIDKQLKSIQNGQQSTESIGKLFLLTTMLANQLHISAEEATRQTVNNLINNLINIENKEENVKDIELTMDGNLL